MAEFPGSGNLLAQTTKIIIAHVASNPVAVGEISTLIETAYAALATAPSGAAAVRRRQPFVPVGKSVTPDHIICLEDGKKLKMLKRYLKTTHGMTPDEYRQRWDLPPDYPMVAPNYAALRSALAKKIGLGTRPRRRRRGR